MDTRTEEADADEVDPDEADPDEADPDEAEADGRLEALPVAEFAAAPETIPSTIPKAHIELPDELR